ncbi:MAG: dihydrofolate reductase [Rhizomicrobium sp.]|nr:dihydrofolate reductase [Rhizomicrobium sp.]
MPALPPISLVVARAENGVIGAGGSLPWHLPGDLKRFKEITLGKPVIMGRKTWDSLPRKPLSGRSNIVLTRDRSFAAEGAVVVHDLDAALALAASENPSEIMVIGGADIFAAALPLASTIHLTEVHGAPAGDVLMPAFPAETWAETARLPAPSHSYVTLVRRR